MRSSLFDYEWQFLTQMITRIHYTASYEELCRLLLEDQLPTLIPFDRAVVFQTGRQNGQGTVAAPYTVGMPNDPKENPFLDRAVIPRWSQFIMAPHSTVFLQSDLIAAEDWLHSDIYRNILGAVPPLLGAGGYHPVPRPPAGAGGAVPGAGQG